MPIAHIFKYGKIGAPTTKMFVPKGQLKNDLWGAEIMVGMNFIPSRSGRGMVGWMSLVPTNKFVG